MMSIPRVMPRHWTGQNTGIGESVNKKRDRRKNGFTLIELIIVLTILGILVGLALPQYKYSLKKAREAVLKEDLFQLRKLIDQYFTDKGKYPTSLQALVDDGYLRQVPPDPMTKKADSWVEVRENPTYEELVPNMEFGIVDVHSASKEKAIDGTTYDTW
jgi:general secretion pathway protein G